MSVCPERYLNKVYLVTTLMNINNLSIYIEKSDEMFSVSDRNWIASRNSDCHVVSTHFCDQTSEVYIHISWIVCSFAFSVAPAQACTCFWLSSEIRMFVVMWFCSAMFWSLCTEACKRSKIPLLKLFGPELREKTIYSKKLVGWVSRTESIEKVHRGKNSLE